MSETGFSDDPLDESDSPREGRGFVPDFLRKMAVAGLGAVFMGEEGLRALASQLKLPKEALSYLLSQAERTKDEVTRILSEELRRFLTSDKLRDEFLKLLSGMTLEVKAQLRLLPQDKEGERAPIRLSMSEVKARSSRKKREG